MIDKRRMLRYKKLQNEKGETGSTQIIYSNFTSSTSAKTNDLANKMSKKLIEDKQVRMNNEILS